MTEQEYLKLEPSLHQAIATNDLDEINALLKAGINSDVVDGYGYTAEELSCLLGRGWCTQTEPQLAVPTIKVVAKGKHIANRYSPASFLHTMGVAYSPTLRFTDLASWLETMKASARLWDKGAWGTQMRHLGETLRPQLYNGWRANLTVIWMGKDLGYGVITNRSLSAGAYLGTYTGVVRRLCRFCPYRNAYCVQYPIHSWLSNHYVLDAKVHGNELRYVNHSTRPNISAAWAYDRQLLHLAFFANQDIPRATPLSINYGQDFWRHRPPPI